MSPPTTEVAPKLAERPQGTRLRDAAARERQNVVDIQAIRAQRREGWRAVQSQIDTDLVEQAPRTGKPVRARRRTDGSKSRKSSAATGSGRSCKRA